MNKFPDNFLWGTATSSYQIEGAAAIDGKGPSIWDAFSSIPGKTHQRENGCAYPDEITDGAVKDQQRVDYYKGYLRACQEAIATGVQLKGYFAWSFMDNFEWASGYDKRFGLHHVDFKTLKRTPKKSAYWFKEVITNNSVE